MASLNQPQEMHPGIARAQARLVVEENKRGKVVGDFTWVVEDCPLCGCEHRHFGGLVELPYPGLDFDDPRKGLTDRHRAAPCLINLDHLPSPFGGIGYYLTDAWPLESEKTIAQAQAAIPRKARKGRAK